MASDPSPYYSSEDPNVSALPLLEPIDGADISRERLFFQSREGPCSNLFAVGTTLFVVVSIVEIANVGIFAAMRYYNQKTLRHVISHSFALPTEAIENTQLRVAHEGIAFDEQRQRLYVFEQLYARLWCIEDCISAPKIAYTSHFDEPYGSYRIGDISLDSQANVIMMLWWEPSRVNPQMALYSGETGRRIELLELDAYFSELVDYTPHIHHHHGSNRHWFALVNNPATNKVHIIYFAHPRFHYMRSVEIPLSDDGSGVDDFQLLDNVNRAGRIKYPNLFLDQETYPLIFGVAMLPNNEYLIQYRHRHGLYDNDGVDFCYLTPPDRRGHRHAYLSTFLFPGMGKYTSVLRTMYWLPASQKVPLVGVTEKPQVFPLQSMYSVPWRPHTHHRFNARTRSAIETMTLVNELGPEERRLPAEMLFEIFQHL